MRIAKEANIIERNFEAFENLPITPEMVLNSINHCYATLDMIDKNLIENGSVAISQLVELANLSSIVGNLLGEGFAKKLPRDLQT